jgi:outer membrane protein assembly factor BamE (lipoprotein component of BamABCDE complex)
MRLAFTSLIFAIALFIAACGASRLTNENLAKATLGMKEDEVIQILGKPHRTDVSETLGIRSTAFYYKQGEREVKIIFINDKLFSKEGSF